MFNALDKFLTKMKEADWQFTVDIQDTGQPSAFD